jgi:SNW domain-containing protein 1
MQQKLAQKEKAAKEENLRLLAQRAREERAGINVPVTGESKPAVMKGTGLGGYASGSESGSDSEDEDREPVARRTEARSGSGSGSESEEDEEDDAAREREKIRREKRQEREREMRLNNMGSEQRAKMLMK